VTRDVDRALAYHRRTVHAPGRYARSLGFLDWDQQPSPFLRFDGAPLVTLARPVLTAAAGPRWDDLWIDAARPAPAPLDRAAIAQLLFDSLALSAWKQDGDARWSLRVNPSSGNLHPTEAYLTPGRDAGVAEVGAVLHYAPREHGLEARRIVDVAGDTVYLALTSIPWREAWKYGERAFRYCALDVGHAIAAVAIAARILGWDTRRAAISDDALASLLGCDDADARGLEAEHAEILLGLCASNAAPTPLVDVLAASRSELAGAPTSLSRAHVPWPVIEEVIAATRDRGSASPSLSLTPSLPPSPTRAPASRADGGYTVYPSRGRALARSLVRARRSAVAMDGESTLPRAAFLRVLETLLPDVTPWVFDRVPTRAVHLLLFVHRVDDVAPGVYALARSHARMPLTGEIEATLPGGYTVYRLGARDVRGLARHLMCAQDLAGDSVFTVAMLAELEPALGSRGAPAYRHLFWECGAIGQLLYLEAESLGLRGTGFGCFFDDAVHDVAGVDGTSLACLYGFAIGGPVEDPRVVAGPAY
jgi:nitroreductase